MDQRWWWEGEERPELVRRRGWTRGGKEKAALPGSRQKSVRVISWGRGLGDGVEMVWLQGRSSRASQVPCTMSPRVQKEHERRAWKGSSPTLLDFTGLTCTVSYRERAKVLPKYSGHRTPSTEHFEGSVLAKPTLGKPTLGTTASALDTMASM